ncbi:MAG TPA: hypothetical protein VGO00_11420, partial [Kofleriaceae bacterium]|nr:hypothetical protein [Kofleriaceae bacterium]
MPRAATRVIAAISLAIATPASAAPAAATLGDAFRAYDANDLATAKRLLAKLDKQDDAITANRDYLA